MYDRLIRNATVVDPVNGYYGIGDVAVQDGRIAAVGRDLPGEAAQVDDATGLTLMPGLIDSHLHLGSMFGSPYGTRMAALAGVTTCLDMAGPIDEIAGNVKDVGPGINVAMLSGFEPKKIFGTETPSEEQILQAIDEAQRHGALGLKIMGGHWPMPLSTCADVIRLCNEAGAYVAWHAGTHTAGSNIKGVREVIEVVGDYRLHLAHINAYCRGRVNPVLDEALEAIELLKAHPNIWCESYVSQMNGTVLTCNEAGEVTDHVTQTCLATYGFPATKQGEIDCIRAHKLFVVKDFGGYSDLIEGEEAVEYFLAMGTKTAGSFPVNPALSRFVIAGAKRDDGSFVVDAISTDGGCIPRNVTISTGLSLVRFGLITLPEFVVKTSVNPARHLKLADRGHLTKGAVADITLFDFERQKAVETIVDGRTVMKNGKILGHGGKFIATEKARPYLEGLGYQVIVTDTSGPEAERFIP